MIDADVDAVPPALNRAPLIIRISRENGEYAVQPTPTPPPLSPTSPPPTPSPIPPPPPRPIHPQSIRRSARTQIRNRFLTILLCKFL